jgi:hypothetical protein
MFDTGYVTVIKPFPDSKRIAIANDMNFSGRGLAGDKLQVFDLCTKEMVWEAERKVFVDSDKMTCIGSNIISYRNTKTGELAFYNIDTETNYTTPNTVGYAIMDLHPCEKNSLIITRIPDRTKVERWEFNGTVAIRAWQVDFNKRYSAATCMTPTSIIVYSRHYHAITEIAFNGKVIREIPMVDIFAMEYITERYLAVQHSAYQMGIFDMKEGNICCYYKCVDNILRCMVAHPYGNVVIQHQTADFSVIRIGQDVTLDEYRFYEGLVTKLTTGYASDITILCKQYNCIDIPL